MPHQLPNLPYDFDALEPHIDSKTMEIHHGKHHKAYVDKLNAALEQAGPSFQDMPIEKLLHDLNKIPENVRMAVRNNGGGHANHTLFWQTMGPNCGGEPSGKLADAIKATFSNFEAFKKQFGDAGVNRFGSGWSWLAVGAGNKLEIFSTPNQDSPLMDGKKPLLGLDVWEHAYYLKYQNRRPDYIAAWWNAVNWKKVGELFAAA